MFGGAPGFFTGFVSLSQLFCWVALGPFHFSIERLFQVVSALGSGLTAITLYRAGLYRKYRFFFAYLVFRVPYIVTALSLPQTGVAYLYLFLYTEPLIMIFYVLIVYELYRLVLKRYRGLYTLGTWAMGVAMTIAVVVSIIGLRSVPAQIPRYSQDALFELRLESRLDLALVLFVVLIVWFLSRYPLRLSRNVVVHTVIYSVFFFANSLGVVLSFFRIDTRGLVNTVLMGIASACAVAWWIGITPRGEEVQLNLPSLGPGAEEQVLHHLEALNATLLKAGRK